MEGVSRASRPALTVAAGALVLLLLIPSPVSAAFNFSLDIVVVVDKPTAVVGDTVNATVYVIWGGTLSDAGYVDLRATVPTATVWTEVVPLAHPSTGVYRGSFQILANMSGAGWISFWSSATVGSLSGSGSASVSLAAEPVFTYRASLSAYDASPGQTVNGALQTYLQGRLADVDSVSIMAYLVSWFGYFNASTLAVQNESVGTYSFSYTVPTGLNESGTVSFNVNANVVALHTTYGLGNFPSLRVDVANPFLIWTHAVASVPGKAAFEVWVADPSGRPVAGASVWVAQWVYGPLPARRASALATTDGSGRASFEFASGSSSTHPYLSLYGYVARGSANESFTAAVGSPLPAYGFDVRRDNPQDLYTAGARAWVNYTATLNGVPYADQAILYTAYNASTLLAYGRVTTDASGRFGLNFTMPSDYASIDLATQGPDGIYYGTNVNVVVEAQIPVEVGTLQVGATGHIVGHLPASGGPWYLSIDFYPTNASGPADSYGGWYAAAQLSGLGLHLGAQTVGGPTFELNLTLPAFLPAGPYYLSIMATSLNSLSPYGSYPYWHVFAAVVTVQAAPPNAALLLLVTLPIVVAIAVAAWETMRRGKRGTPPRRTEPPAPPPAG